MITPSASASALGYIKERLVSFITMNGTARYWILTIPEADFVRPEQPAPEGPYAYQYLRGQLELAPSGYRHWQLVVYFASACRLGSVKRIFGASCHAEPTRSKNAMSYVWKDETSILGTRFEFGERPGPRGKNKRDWDAILRSAKSGQFEEIPADVLVRSYGSIKRIAQDYCQPVPIIRTTKVYWGATGTGKSRTAWTEAGFNAFPKDPSTKFWCGYRGQEHVVLDEFRGSIGISHILRWLDRYPVIVEVKGSAVVLAASTIWITSNIHPREWYPELDQATLDALLRRLNITEFH